jgi:thiosulfate dehydrogenase
MFKTQNRIVLIFGLASLVMAPADAFASEGKESGNAGGAAAAPDVTVSLCDGETVMSVPGLKAGEALPPARAKEVAGQMMQSWRRTQGDERWAAWSRAMKAETASLAGGGASSQDAPQATAPPQPTKFTARDLQLWQREEKKWIDEGYQNYHNAKAVGGTIGISCDMCHPDGSNTHPETYPKFQSQTKKVALLRDMINWCIENPLKGKPLAENDPVLRSLEAYILSTRKGTPIEAGKH